MPAGWHTEGRRPLRVARTVHDSAILNITSVPRLVYMQDQKPRSPRVRSGMTHWYPLRWMIMNWQF